MNITTSAVHTLQKRRSLLDKCGSCRLRLTKQPERVRHVVRGLRSTRSTGDATAECRRERKPLGASVEVDRKMRSSQSSTPTWSFGNSDRARIAHELRLLTFSLSHLSPCTRTFGVEVSGQFANRRRAPPVQEILDLAASLVS
jgi:hypothetical protein